MNGTNAQDIAGDVLLWLCGQEELLGVFLSATGADVGDLRAGLQAGAPDPGLSTAALDFVLMRDETVLDAAASLDLSPDRLAMAAAVLAGEAGRHWT
jgi:hypothetical protein